MQYDLPAKEHPHFSKKGMLEFHPLGFFRAARRFKTQSGVT
jgi:hypothetical protein